MTPTPNNENRRVRWTDEMLDSLATDVSELRESVSEMRESISEMRESISEMRESISELRESFSEVRESVSEVRDSIDGLRITAQALLQVAAQQQQENEARKAEIAEWKEESNRRFYTLLEEVRYLTRKVDRNNGESQE
ncbi:hypothetical protein H6S82_08490 [Planktothrix sp. FACHB-1355]|uniref:Uncharacterized protein n=1 Tax=Aerosakkonema funiforme FACHB-1375 TaxID=2949571 RepID=A0A926VFI1_9CYAN|nr:MULTISPECIES: hypothetical protein [Oscillatoriales]MBD2182929.1 hypothetical protein [Aerosakkonema funiforme FACHB-1375]MBD3558895.1 hypothetical protein [Planktothrix sp. FACHB-1355]